MFYPKNINKFLNSNKETDKNGFVILSIGGIFLGGLIVTNSISRFLVAYYIPRLVTFGIFIILFLVLVFFILDTFIFSSKDSLKEFSSSEKDSISRYYQIRESELPKVYDEVEMFEYVDGSLAFGLELFYGSVNTNKTINSLKNFEIIFNDLLSFSKDISIFVCKQNFEDSIECKNLLSSINKSDNKKLSSVISEMVGKMLDITYDHSRLYNTYIVVRFNPSEMDNITMVKNKIKSIVDDDNSTIRRIEFLSKPRLRDFIVEYFNVEFMDLSGFRNEDITKMIYRKYIGIIDRVKEEYQYEPIMEGMRIYRETYDSEQ